MTDKVTDAITGELTEPLPGRLPPHNIKDKEIYKSHNISMEKMESMLLEEREWHSSILTRLSTAITSDKLTDYLKIFFAYQKKKGVKSRAIEDVKFHFQNWLSKKLEKIKDMEIMNKKSQIRVEELKYRLLQQRITNTRFKLPMSFDDAKVYLLAAYQAEVERRHRVFERNEHFDAQLNLIANYLTGGSKKFGLMF